MQAPIQPDQFKHVRRQFAGVHGSFGQHNAVFQSVSDRMLERLNVLAIEPRRVPSPARWWQRLHKSVTQVTADPHQLPFADGSFDLVVSNLLLPWCHEPATVFSEVGRILAENGAFMFTSAGPDTLQEYSELWRRVDSFAHVFGLADMHQTGDELLNAGFSAPVLDREVITVDYPSIDALQDEMRMVGAANLACGRRNGLMASDTRKILREEATKQRFVVTLELVHGHGWKGSLPQNRHNSSEDFSVSLDSLRQSLRGSSR